MPAARLCLWCSALQGRARLQACTAPGAALVQFTAGAHQGCRPALHQVRRWCSALQGRARAAGLHCTRCGAGAVAAGVCGAAAQGSCSARCSGAGRRITAAQGWLIRVVLHRTAAQRWLMLMVLLTLWWQWLMSGLLRCSGYFPEVRHGRRGAAAATALCQFAVSGSGQKPGSAEHPAFLR